MRLMETAQASHMDVNKISFTGSVFVGKKASPPHPNYLIPAKTPVQVQELAAKR